MERDLRLERDIVETFGFLTSFDDNRIEIMIPVFDLPRNARGWGEIGIGWRVTLPSGEQGIVTEHWQGLTPMCAIESPKGFPKMWAKAKRRKKAPRERIRIERFAENVVAIGNTVQP